jgi:hypothetical protein
VYVCVCAFLPLLLVLCSRMHLCISLSLTHTLPHTNAPLGDHQEGHQGHVIGGGREVLVAATRDSLCSAARLSTV